MALALLKAGRLSKAEALEHLHHQTKAGMCSLDAKWGPASRIVLLAHNTPLHEIVNLVKVIRPTRPSLLLLLLHCATPNSHLLESALADD